MTGRRPLLLTLALAMALAGCSSAGDGDPARRGATPSSSSTAASKYVALAEAIAARNKDVWVEADLLKAHLKGPESYARALAITLDLADRPGVVGVKIADELGYRDGSTPDQAEAFVRQAGADIRAHNPRLKVLIDMVVPELGCLSWRNDAAYAQVSCRTSAVGRDQGSSLASVDRYLATGSVDVLDLSPGLRDDDWYDRLGTSRDAAMTQCWQEAVRRWGSKTELHARKALAHSGRYTSGAAQAEADVHTFVDIPLENGARAVDIWAWSQTYQGKTMTLTDPGIQPNALTEALQSRRQKGVKLWTHMTPSTLQVGLAADVAGVTSHFDAVFVAAGAG